MAFVPLYWSGTLAIENICIIHYSPKRETERKQIRRWGLSSLQAKQFLFRWKYARSIPILAKAFCIKILNNNNMEQWKKSNRNDVCIKDVTTFARIGKCYAKYDTIDSSWLIRFQLQIRAGGGRNQINVDPVFPLRLKKKT